jgi:hypothetical protein
VQDNHAKAIIDHGAMSARQWLAVLVTVGLNAMDGFDVLSISFASPGIATDWGVDKGTLAWALCCWAGWPTKSGGARPSSDAFLP